VSTKSRCAIRVQSKRKEAHDPFYITHTYSVPIPKWNPSAHAGLLPIQYTPAVAPNSAFMRDTSRPMWVAGQPCASVQIGGSGTTTDTVRRNNQVKIKTWCGRVRLAFTTALQEFGTGAWVDAWKAQRMLCTSPSFARAKHEATFWESDGSAPLTTFFPTRAHTAYRCCICRSVRLSCCFVAYRHTFSLVEGCILRVANEARWGMCKSCAEFHLRRQSHDEKDFIVASLLACSPDLGWLDRLSDSASRFACFGNSDQQSAAECTNGKQGQRPLRGPFRCDYRSR
jgi:hypothetical protein